MKTTCAGHILLAPSSLPWVCIQCQLYLRGSRWDTFPHHGTGGRDLGVSCPRLCPSTGTHLGRWWDGGMEERVPSTVGSTASRTPSNAFRVRNRLNFHCKSKFQIQTGKISWSVLWMGGAGPSSCLCFQISTLVTVLRWVQKE